MRRTDEMTTAGGQALFLPLDALRGVAALAVVLFHARVLTGGQWVPRGYLAVDLFFVMSGVVIAHAYNQRLRQGGAVWRFLWIRIIRFAPFYLLGTLFGLMLAALVLLSGGGGSWAMLARDLALAAFMLPNPLGEGKADLFPLNPPAWSLFYELAVNMAYALALPWLDRRPARLVTVTALCGIGLAVLVGSELYAVNSGPLAAHWPVTVLRVGWAFGLGVLIHRHWRRDGLAGLPGGGLLAQLPGWSTWGLILCAVVPFVLPVTGTATDALVDLGYVLGVAPVLVAALLAVSQRPMGQGATRLSLWLGVLSYGVYATHQPLIWLVNGMALRLPLPLGVVAPAALAGLILMVVLFDHFIDRPLRRTLRGRR